MFFLRVVFLYLCFVVSLVPGLLQADTWPLENAAKITLVIQTYCDTDNLNIVPPRITAPPPAPIDLVSSGMNVIGEIPWPLVFIVFSLLILFLIVYLLRKYLFTRGFAKSKSDELTFNQMQSESLLDRDVNVFCDTQDEKEFLNTNKKEILLRQKRVYETQYTELIDRKTELQALGVTDDSSVNEIKKKLSIFSCGLNSYLRKKIIKSEISYRKLILHTLFYTFFFRNLLLPLWRKLATPAKVILVLAAGYLVFEISTYIIQLSSKNGQAVLNELLMYVAIFYLVSLPVLFLIEKLIFARRVYRVIKNNANDFNHIKLIHRPEEFFKKGNYYQAMCVSSIVRPDILEPQAMLLESDIEELKNTAFQDFVEIINDERAVALFSISKQHIASQFLWCARFSPFMEQYGDLVNSYFNITKQQLDELQLLMGNVTESKVEFIGINKKITRLQEVLNNINNMMKVWSEVCISDTAFDFIMRRIDLFNIKDQSVPNGIILYGISGNGKTYLSKAISESLLISYTPIDVTAIKTTSDVRKIWAKHRKKRGVLFYINHAEQIFPHPKSSITDSNSKDVVHAWINEWTKHTPAESNIWVVLSTDDPKLLHPLILREIGVTQLEVSAPDTEGRELVLNKAIREFGFFREIPSFVVKVTAGSTILELRELVAEVKRRTLSDQTSDEISDEIWRKTLADVRGDDTGLRQSEKKWDNLILSTDIKDHLMHIAKILLEADEYKQHGIDVPAGILLYGPPGTGKTEIARTLANESGLFFIAATTSDLKGEHIGESGQMVRNLFSKARAKAPSILFIDEIETVVPKRAGNGGDTFTADIVSQMLTEMDGVKSNDKHVFVLAATNLPNEIDTAILSRFNDKIEVPLPGEIERKKILEVILRLKFKNPTFNVDQTTSEVARILKGRSGRDLKMFVNRVLEKEVIRAGTPEQINLTSKKFILEANQLIDKASKRDKSKTWERLIIPESIKERLKSICNILYNAHEFSNTGVDIPKGMLIYGPPGTGKTEIARTLANESGLHLDAVSTVDLKAGFLGESVHKVAKVFAKAREQSPSILFIDEIDAVAPDRDGNLSEISLEIVNQLLQEMDGANNDDRHVFVLAATNLPNNVDKAIKSRLSVQLEIPLPDLSARKNILRIFLAEKLKCIDWNIDEMVENLAQLLVGKSGRDLKNIINVVVELEALRAGSPKNMKLTADHFIKEATALMDLNVNRDKSKTWSKLVLPLEIKERLQQITRIFERSEQFIKSGVELPIAMVLYGPPGTGKTEIARTLANESQMYFLSATTSEIKGTHLGESASNVAKLFAQARDNSPCILFLDELEAVAAKRAGQFADQYTGEIVNQLLQELDGVRDNKATPVFVLAATNIPEAIDSAVLSRFSDKIEISLPNRQARLEIISILLQQKIPNLNFDIKIAAEKLEHLFEGKSGRDIKQFVSKIVAQELLRAGTVNRMSISLDDLVTAATPSGTSVSEDDLNKIWNSLVLPDDTKNIILGKLELFNKADPAAPKGLLLYGPPGTGKTEIAKKIAMSASCHFMSLSMSDLKAGHVGQSSQNVRKIWNEARSRGQCVMFVDECEGVFAKRGSLNSDSFSDDIVQSFLAEWDGIASGGQIWVVAATNRVELLDEAILSRFNSQIKISLPDVTARFNILKLELQKLNRDWHIPSFIAKQTVGFSGRKLAALLKEVVAAVGKGEPNDEYWHTALQQLVASSSDAVETNAKWENLVLATAIKDKLQTICQMLKHLEMLANQGIDPPRGMILYGPPGTGKTQIARTIANESGLTFISASTANIKAGYTGQSAQNVAEFFERARSSAPAIIFIDEIDAIACDRDSFTQDIVAQLLQELDGVKAQSGYVFVLAATNFIENITPAVLSRFPEKVEIPLPDRDQRQQIILYLIEKFKYCNFDLKDCSEKLADAYEGLSGRDIRSQIETAQNFAVMRAMANNQPERIQIQLEDFPLLEYVPDALMDQL